MKTLALPMLALAIAAFAAPAIACPWSMPKAETPDTTAETKTEDQTS